jgi:DNA-binding NarL/FixJ family response regulator
MGPALRLFLATDRSGVDTYFRNLPTGDEVGLSVQRVRLDGAAVARATEPEHADVAVVDVDGDHRTPVEIVSHLRSRRRGLPIVALLCCCHGITPKTLRELSAAGVGSMLDLYATPEQAWRTVAAAARGEAVVHLRLGNGSDTLWRDLLSGELGGDEPSVQLTVDDTRVLHLVSQGLSDHEMGSRLYLSPHTVKHRVEHLRQKVGARNRIALAAWAGRQGLDHEPSDMPVYAKAGA